MTEIRFLRATRHQLVKFLPTIPFYSFMQLPEAQLRHISNSVQSLETLCALHTVRLLGHHQTYRAQHPL